MSQAPKIQSGGPKDLRFFCCRLGIRADWSKHRTADGIRLDGGRNLIGRRTESDRMANGIRSDGERNPIGRRSVQNVITTATTLVLPSNNKNK
jgi:hypothetical protein